MARNSASTQRPSFRRPTILVGSDATLLGRSTIDPRDAAAAGLYGLDLDLRRSWQSGDPSDVERIETTRIRSIWLPPWYAGPFTEYRVERLRRFLTEAATHHGLRTIVLGRTANSQSHTGVPLSQVAQKLGELHGIRFALAVSASELLREPGSHLDHVANVRRFAEEWELDIALDLTAPDLAGWETEAALMRLFPRLTLVRIGPMHTADGIHAMNPTASVALRTVTMLADQAYGALISVAAGPPQSPWWSWVSRPGLELAISAREEIIDTYDRIDQYDISARESRPRFW